MLLHGWGRYPKISAQLLEPASTGSLLNMLRSEEPNKFFIARGAGRSYGDSALGSQVISSRYLDNLFSLDTKQGLLHCGAGLTIDQLLQVCIPKGWFPAVVPGTKFVSIGGAIAADIHGKNHHLDGSFSEFVDSISLALADGQILRCSRTENSEIFHATCGGMGLTGMIVDATIRLEKVSSVFIKTRALASNNLNETLALLDEYNKERFVVAWLDCLAEGAESGRGIVHIGDFDNSDKLKVHNRWGPSVPFSTPSLFLNKYSMQFFNNLYYKMNGNDSETTESYDEYFFPLDSIGIFSQIMPTSMIDHNGIQFVQQRKQRSFMFEIHGKCQALPWKRQKVCILFAKFFQYCQESRFSGSRYFAQNFFQAFSCRVGGQHKLILQKAIATIQAIPVADAVQWEKIFVVTFSGF